MAEKAGMICVPVETYAAHPEMVVMPGSVEAKCYHCGTPIIVSPSGMERVAKGEVEVICLRCGMGNLVGGGNLHEMTEAQKEEMRKAGVSEEDIEGAANSVAKLKSIQGMLQAMGRRQ